MARTSLYNEQSLTFTTLDYFPALAEEPFWRFNLVAQRVEFEVFYPHPALPSPPT
jgi:hypothetical protein